MASTIKVSMADLKVAKAPDSLTTLGLGSCIGLTLYDPASKIGGLVHYMLPDSTKLRNNTNIAKFGDTGIRELYNQMIKNGANPRRMVAKIAGGAKMFEMSGNSTIGNVGDRNTDMARHVLFPHHFASLIQKWHGKHSEYNYMYFLRLPQLPLINLQSKSRQSHAELQTYAAPNRCKPPSPSGYYE